MNINEPYIFVYLQICCPCAIRPHSFYPWARSFCHCPTCSPGEKYEFLACYGEKKAIRPERLVELTKILAAVAPNVVSL